MWHGHLVRTEAVRSELQAVPLGILAALPVFHEALSADMWGLARARMSMQVGVRACACVHVRECACARCVCVRAGPTVMLRNVCRPSLMPSGVVHMALSSGCSMFIACDTSWLTFRFAVPNVFFLVVWK